MKQKPGIDWMLVGTKAVVFLSGVAAFLIHQYEMGNLRPTTRRPDSFEIPFELDRPVRTLTLVRRLDEISGIAIDPTGTFAWTVNDEEGVLFQVDLESATTTESSRFAGNGDYEAITMVPDAIVVARSDGTLWRLQAGSQELIPGPLSYHNDVEGLEYDPRGQRILVACKGRPARKGKYKGHKAIYSVSLPDYQWSEKPAYLVGIDALTSFLEANPTNGLKPKMAKKFAPSALAIDPKSGHIYLLSTTGRMLVVLDRDLGTIIGVAYLPRAIFTQPEGMTFDKEANLYISSEGRDDRGAIMRFNRTGISRTTKTSTGAQG